MVEELKLETEYKGFKIRWDAYSKQWDILLDGKFLKRQETPDKAQEYIDKLEKINFVRQSILLCQGHGIDTRFLPATVTSLSDGMAWVTETTAQGKKRSREEMISLILDTPENRASIKEILDSLQQIEKLNKKVELMSKGMTRLTPEMLGKEPPDAPK